MLLLAILPPLLGCLAAGCLAFYFCAAIPPLRRFALSASLWLASLAVLVPAAYLPNMMFFVVLHGKWLNGHVPVQEIASRHVRLLVAFNILTLIVIASLITLAHGFVVRRLTFLLFRLYVTAVTFGVAVTLSWVSYLVTSILMNSFMLGASAACIALAFTTLSVYAYRHASLFRGSRPIRLQPVSMAEYSPEVML